LPTTASRVLVPRRCGWERAECQRSGRACSTMGRRR
jgi:hypothetical protein